MIPRRDLLAGAAGLATLGAAALRAAAQERLTEADLLGGEPFGQVTLLHVADLHGQMLPMHFREASVNVGVGEGRGRPPFLTGAALRDHFRIPPGTPMAHAVSHESFETLARRYGRMGGLDRIATLVRAIRETRPGRTLLLDSGDTWQGGLVSLETRGMAMVEVMALLRPEAMTGHWEFTYGAGRVTELIEAAEAAGTAFLAGNVQDNEWNEDVFPASALFERGGVAVAVIGQAFPYTPIANPRWMIPDWSMGIQEEKLARRVEEARAAGAEVVVLLSHNGFAVDRRLAARVRGIDVILVGHTHDCTPQPIRVGDTLLVASGAHGKFLTRLDLEVAGGRVSGVRHALIPVFSEAIRPDPEMRAAIARARAPHEARLARVVGRSATTLFRRGNINGTWDDLICDALLAERDAEIALSPGFRWGPSLLADSPITVEDIHAQTAITYPAAWRMEMTGAQLKDLLEDVCDNLFNPDPFYQQGGDMVRAGGLGFTIEVDRPAGRRITDLRLLPGDEPLQASRRYVVAGWASVNEDVQGPPIWELLERHIARLGTVAPVPNTAIRLSRE
ncbi:MAG: thiosulfohydrolase SoxB [Acetobacteraceae bacterium]